MDAFPVTFLEAAACERPVISIRLPSYAGTFAEQFARMVEPGSIDQLADAMVDVVTEDPTQRAQQLSHARQLVRDRYDERITARRLVEIYEELIEGMKHGSEDSKWQTISSV